MKKEMQHSRFLERIAEELRVYLGASHSELEAVALIDILCFCDVVFPSGLHINELTDDAEPIGRENASIVLALISGHQNYTKYKSLYDAKSTEYSASQLRNSYVAMSDRLRRAGFQVSSF